MNVTTVKPSSKRPRVVSRPPRLLVAVALDRPSADALRRGFSLARALDLEPSVVHVIAPSGDANGSAARPTRDFVRTRLHAIQEWSLFETGIALPARRIRILVGDPVAELAKKTRDGGTRLFVLGGHDHPGAPPGRLTHALLARAACPVLVCGSQGGQDLVVGTDLSDPEAPIVRTAAWLAERLGKPLSIVHNVAGITLHGITYPLSGSLARQVLREQRERLEALAHDVSPRTDVTLMQEPTAVDAILQVAQRRKVGLLVVGVRRGEHEHMGLTTESVLTEAQSSVLAVPLGA